MNIEENILYLHKHENTVETIAKKLNISNCTVRKTLATHGIYTSDRALQIKKLYEAGKNEEEIAQELNLSKKYVNGYLPYRRGSYLNENKTKNALNIKRYREKLKTD